MAEAKDAAGPGDGFKAPAPRPKGPVAPMSVNVTGDSWSQRGHGLMLPPKPKLPAPPATAATPPAAAAPDAAAPAAPPAASAEAPAAPAAAAAKGGDERSVEWKYTAPVWSPKAAVHPWSFEVLRNGAALGVQSLSHKGALLVGRLPVCDIELEHDSVSRQHAVIQHRSTGQVYVYDLNSTHGTFVNKRKVKPMVYVPLRNGDMVRFGQTTRVFVLQGGPEEEEAPPQAQAQTGQAPAAPQTQKTGGGDGEGGGGGEGGDVFTGNIADLKNFMKQQQAKAKGGGKKGAAKGALGKDMLPELAKQARAAFKGQATEGGRREGGADDGSSSSEDEDPLGLGVGVEGGKKRKKKEKKGKKGKKDEEEEEPEDLEITKHGTVADEFYSSGEENDDFYDRTKSKSRGAGATGAASASKALTPDDLRAALRDLERKREDALFALHEAKATAEAKARKEEDELDAFMAGVKGTIEAQRERQLAARLDELNAEHARLSKLLNLTQSALERVQPSQSAAPISATTPSSAPAPAPSTSPVSANASANSTQPPATLSLAERRQRALDPTGSLAAYLNQFEKEPKKKEGGDAAPEAAEGAGPELTPDIEARLGTVRRKRAGEEAVGEGKGEAKGGKARKAFVEKAEEVVTWVPPADQKGDGRTKLNERFGY